MGLIENVSKRIIILMNIILLIQDMIKFGLIDKQRDMRKEQSVSETDLTRLPVEANIVVLSPNITVSLSDGPLSGLARSILILLTNVIIMDPYLFFSFII